MDILIITTDFPPNLGGIAYVFKNWAEGLAKNGLRVFVLAPKTRVYFPLFYPLYLLYLLLFLRPRRIIVGPVLPAGLMVFFFSFFFNFQYFIPAFGNELVIQKNSGKQKLAFFLKRKILGRAEKILPCSNFSASLVEKFGIEKEKIRVIYPGVSPPLLHHLRPLHHLHHLRVILTVGRLVKRKGQEKVIAAMKLILQKIPNAIYLIVGQGPEHENLKFKIKNSKLENHVFIFDKISDEELPYFYQNCDVFAMISENILREKEIEGFGIVYLEAGLFKKPVVATKTGGVPEAVIDGKTGLLVKNPKSEKEIAAKIIKLLENRKLAQRLGGNASQRIKKELNWKVSIKKLKEILNG